MKKCSLALLLCLVLGLVPLLSTHALADGEEETQPVETAQTEAAVTETTVPTETTLPSEETTVSTEEPALPAETAATTPDVPSTQADIHEEAEEMPNTCTCGGEDDVHQEGCPLYTPVQVSDSSGHTAPCTDECAEEACLCSCHLFQRLMAAEDPAVFFSLLESVDDQALTPEQITMLEAKAEALSPQPAPPLVLTQCDPAVESEIYVPTANYAKVAPFGQPVSSGTEGGRK